MIDIILYDSSFLTGNIFTVITGELDIFFFTTMLMLINCISTGLIRNAVSIIISLTDQSNVYDERSIIKRSKSMSTNDVVDPV